MCAFVFIGWSPTSGTRMPGTSPTHIRVCVCVCVCVCMCVCVCVCVSSLELTEIVFRVKSVP